VIVETEAYLGVVVPVAVVASVDVAGDELEADPAVQRQLAADPALGRGPVVGDRRGLEVGVRLMVELLLEVHPSVEGHRALR